MNSNLMYKIFKYDGYMLSQSHTAANTADDYVRGFFFALWHVIDRRSRRSNNHPERNIP